MKQSVLMKIVVGRENEQLLPSLSWLEREAVNLKVGNSSLSGSGSHKLAPCGRVASKTGSLRKRPGANNVLVRCRCCLSKQKVPAGD